MANERQEPKPASADPDVRMDTELEADIRFLTLSEGKASGLQHRERRLSTISRDRRCEWRMALSQP